MRRYPTSGIFVSRSQNVKGAFCLDSWKLDPEYIKRRNAKRLARRNATTQRQALKLMARGKIRLR